MNPPADLEDFSLWRKWQHDGRRYRRRTVRRYTGWIEEERSTYGHRWWVVEDATNLVVTQSDDEDRVPPPPTTVPVFAWADLTPAQLEVMLNAILEVMHSIGQVRRTGEVPQVDPRR